VSFRSSRCGAIAVGVRQRRGKQWWIIAGARAERWRWLRLGVRLSPLMADDPKSILRDYLQTARDALLWKLDGLSEYDARRPLTPTGSNLLGIVKHVASVELGYLGDVFGRPSGEAMPWFEPGAEANADMWATAEESRAQIVALYHRSWAHGDVTIDLLPLDAVGRVPWWGDRGEVTLHRILVHLIAETNRHAGQMDIMRESIDGAVGYRAGNDNLPGESAEWWAEYHQRVETAARTHLP
jgi:uncharacterized damage-inducible protein DinB